MLTPIGLLQILVYLFVLFLLIKPLGWYMAVVYEGRPFFMARVGRPIERLLCRLCSIQPVKEMDWKQYLSSMMIFNLCGFLAVYFLQRFQAMLPLNPQHFPAPDVDLALNTAMSFVTNTDWQSYGGETTLSYLTQMLALTTQNFLSAATGMSVVIAFSRGLARHDCHHLGNFWVDTVRGIVYILLPMALIFACLLVSQGVIQNIAPNQHVQWVDGPGKLQSFEQVIPMGPVASQEAIKQLGTNGGGFFNVNAAHPFENPTPITNFFEMLAILLIPAALCYTFGIIVHDKRQGWAILGAMLLIFIPFMMVAVVSEQAGNPAFTSMGISQQPDPQMTSGGNMEGKETRFGIVSSALWATATTATSNGSVNSMHDSFTPLGGLIPLWMMHLGEIIFGGVGSGLYGMLMLVMMAVFIAGLMVGRAPEYLGKKIEPYEMKMASITVLVMPLTVLLATALAVVTKMGNSSISNPGAHGLTEILYAFTSMASNNGSAFAGLNANTPFYNLVGGLLIFIGRYGIAIPTLAIAGSLVQKKKISKTSGTLGTHTFLFVILLVSIIIILGALSFLPVLALGPIVEQLNLWGHYG